MRTFIAIALPESTRQQVTAQQRRLQQHLQTQGAGAVLRWTPTDNLHLTVRFLGETSDAQRRQVEAALHQIAGRSAPFSLAVHGLGCFPNLRRPNIVWLDFVGDLAQLQAVQRQVETAVQAAGFAAEERSFTPHLTIARAQKSASPSDQQRAGEALRRLIESQGQSQAGGEPFVVDHLHFIESELRPSGSVYTTLLSAPLASGG